MVSVAGYRDREILELAHKRISTILIGGATCVIITIVVCPVWAGEDLQNLVALNLEKIGNYLEGRSIFRLRYMINEEMTLS